MLLKHWNKTIINIEEWNILNKTTICKPLNKM